MSCGPLQPIHRRGFLFETLTTTREERHMADLPPYPGTPRWVKVFGIIALVMVLLFVILLFTRGPHRGPGDHEMNMPSGGQTPPSSVTADRTPSSGLGGHDPS
jgi:hypothetical protein